MDTRIIQALGFIAMVVPATSSWAGERVEPKEDLIDSRVSFSLGVDWTNAYFFRGYLQEDRGFIAQPHAEFTFDLVPAVEENDVSIYAVLGTWNSFHSKKTGASGTGVDTWYEADFYGGVGFGWKNWSLGITYNFYSYPNDATASTVQELVIDLGVDLNDGTFVGQMLGEPTLTFAVETNNSNVGDDRAAFLGLGFGPSFDIFDGKATLSVPVELGFSLSRFYDGDRFGYASLGLAVDVPLSSGPFGDIALTAGVNGLLLGDTARRVNRNDRGAVSAFVGISLTY